jgi:hypothetical protein
VDFSGKATILIFLLVMGILISSQAVSAPPSNKAEKSPLIQVDDVEWDSSRQGFVINFSVNRGILTASEHANFSVNIGIAVEYDVKLLLWDWHGREMHRWKGRQDYYGPRKDASVSDYFHWLYADQYPNLGKKKLRIILELEGPSGKTFFRTNSTPFLVDITSPPTTTPPPTTDGPCGDACPPTPA